MPSVSENTRIKRRVAPLLQGDLDGLCGIYAIINAMRALCPELTDEISMRLFRIIMKSLAKHSEEGLPLTFLGIEGALFWKLLVDATAYLKRKLSVDLALQVGPPELRVRSIELAWDNLASVLDDTTVIILPLSGLSEHWTVLYDANPKKIRLIDSSDDRKLKRSHCTLKSTKTLNHLRLSTAIVVSRREGKAKWSQSAD